MKKRKSPAFAPNLDIAEGRKNGGSAKAKPIMPASKARRATSKRRRKIDPTTCQSHYIGADAEFITAMDHYKRDNRRPFPTWSETLEVLHALGYRRVAEPTKMPGPSANKRPKAKT